MSLEDKAQEHEAAEWAIRNAPRPERPTYTPSDPGYGPKECDECEATMPAFRRQHGWRLCTNCQSLAERGRLRR